MRGGAREREEERKAKTDIRSVRNAAGILMRLRVGGESAGSR